MGLMMSQQQAEMSQHQAEMSQQHAVMSQHGSGDESAPGSD